MKRIHFKHGFTYKGQPYGWHEKELYRLPFRSGLRNYPLKKLSMIKTGNQLGYCCSRDKLSSYQLRAMTHEIDVVVSIADKNIMPF